MRIRLAIPDRLVTAGVLDAVLEASTRAAAAQIRAGEAPDARELLASGARWRPEPYVDGEHFDLPSVIAARGWGDCDDWGPALAGSLRASGDDPGARAIAYKSGPSRYHVVTQLSDGRIVDPSLEAGMKPHPGIRGATVRSMVAGDRGGLALTHDGRAWCARCDVPWPGGRAHVASIARSRDRSAALARAAVGARYVGDAVSSPLAARAEEVADQLLAVGDASDVISSAEQGAKYGGEIAPALALIPGVGPALAAFAPGVGAAIGAIVSLFGGKAGLKEGSFNQVEGQIQQVVQAVEILTTKEQAAALRKVCVEINNGLASLQGQRGLSDWDRQHCADLGQIVLAAAARIDQRAASLPNAAPAPAPADAAGRVAAQQAGRGARVSTLPGGASIAWSQDGRTMVVRF